MRVSGVLLRPVKLWKSLWMPSWQIRQFATAGDVGLMAKAFRQAVEAGRNAYLAGIGESADFQGDASRPVDRVFEVRIMEFDNGNVANNNG